MTPYKIEERLLTVENLSLKYGARTIFRDVNLEIDNITRPGMLQGQVVSLLGPSGIGKTQMFRCLAGLNQPTTGQVLLNPTKAPVQAGQVGIVFQNYPLLQHRTIWDNLKIASEKSKKTEEEITKLLELFELLDKKKLYPAQLSGGQQQRIAIIQQILCSEHFILMDEPFSGLDIAMKQKAINLIHKVAEADELITMIVTTHDIAAAIEISDTIWVLGNEEGKEGATVLKKFDMVARDLAWNPDVTHHKNFYPTLLEISAMFK